MDALRLERFLVGVVALVLAAVVAVQAGLFVRAEFQKAAAALVPVKQQVRR